MQTITNPYIQGDDILWINFNVKKIISQSANGRSEISSQTIGKNIKLIAPKELAMDVGHTWSEYESMSGRIAEITTKGSKIMADAGAVGSAIGKAATGNISGATGAVLNVPVKWHRQDTALTYSGSERRDFRFDFELSTYNDPKREVFDIVRSFEEYSSPIMKGNLTNILPPYIFSINTVYGDGKTTDLINIENAALVAVSPSYSSPYILGYPSKCNLSLSFKEIDPLFRGNFKSSDTLYSNIINTSEDETYGR